MAKRPRKPHRSPQAASKPIPAPDTGPQLCAVCGDPRAFYGFGPPLTPKTVWACREHRAQVDPETSLPDWLR